MEVQRKTVERRAADKATPGGILSQEQVARRAYELYLSRGRRHGADLDDWLQAERELRAAPRLKIPAPRKPRQAAADAVKKGRPAGER
jgi:hypothetical protein